MKVLVQRVKRAGVEVGGEKVAAIAAGLLVLSASKKAMPGRRRNIWRPRLPICVFLRTKTKK